MHRLIPIFAQLDTPFVRLPLVFLCLCLLNGCGNNPYRPGETAKEIYFVPYSTEPTHLDPTRGYYSHEGAILSQIYEPPFTYHYLKRPYALEPNTAVEVPSPVYFGHDGEILEGDPPAADVARTEYTIKLKQDIGYQDHPCFAKDANGKFVYHDWPVNKSLPSSNPNRFPKLGTRKATAHDYALQIRRICDMRHNCPVQSTLATYILGMDDLTTSYTEHVAMVEELRRQAREDDITSPTLMEQVDIGDLDEPIRFDYFAFDFPGCVVIDDHTYKIVLKKKYPQILYWMCMHFFAPMPQEALDFYEQTAMKNEQITLHRWPIGSGPYYIDVMDPVQEIIFLANPNYRDDFYPTEKDEDDPESILADAGEKLPFIKKQVWKMEQESISSWSKFIQGYYDLSAIDSQVFDQAVNMEFGSEPKLTDEMAAKGINLFTAVDTSFWYMQFNMLDDVVGGYTEEKRKLRQAISIAYDTNTYLNLFLNGRGIPSNGPIPPGIFGYVAGEAGVNPYTDTWNETMERYERQSLEKAKQLLAEAGYPGGIGPDGKPLTLYYDHSAAGIQAFKEIMRWTIKQYAKLGIELKDRGTELSQFREKRKKGNWQVATSGWIADYPDPENFLFLFYGPNGQANYDGSNSTNYESEEFDRLFQQFESMNNGPERQKLINELMDILRKDAPAIWTFYPMSYSLIHEWIDNYKPHTMTRNTIKYRRVDAELRAERQAEWNKPNPYPVALLLLALLGLIVPVAIRNYKRERGLA